MLLVAFVGGTALADAKLGGVARQLSMGGGGFRGIAVNPFIWDDPTQMYLNPAYGNKYKDYIWMNAGGGSLTGTTSSNDGYGLQNGGVNFSLGSNLSVGTILSHDPTLTNTVAGALAIGGVGINSGLTLAPVEVLQFFGAYALGSNMSLGVRLLYGWSSNDNIVGGTAPGTNEYSASVIGLSAGILYDLGSGSAVEGAVAFSSSSADDMGGLVTPPVNGEASATEIGISLRGKLRINNKVNFIPVVAFASASGDGNNGGTAPTTADVSGTSLGIGVGADLHVGDFYLAGGISYGSTSLETTTTPFGGMGTVTKNTTSGFPVIQIGGEWMFTDWLTGRLGYVRSFTTFSTETTPPAPGATTETNMFTGWSVVGVGSYNQDNLVVFGLAGSFGNFGFEATVSESALRRGFAIVGSSDNLNSFGYLTANYNFN